MGTEVDVMEAVEKLQDRFSRTYTTREDDILQRGTLLGMSYADISRFLPGRTPSALQQRAAIQWGGRAGVARAYSKKYGKRYLPTEEDRKFFGRFIPPALDRLAPHTNGAATPISTEMERTSKFHNPAWEMQPKLEQVVSPAKAAKAVKPAKRTRKQKDADTDAAFNALKWELDQMRLESAINARYVRLLCAGTIGLGIVLALQIIQ